MLHRSDDLSSTVSSRHNGTQRAFPNISSIFEVDRANAVFLLEHEAHGHPAVSPTTYIGARSRSAIRRTCSISFSAISNSPMRSLDSRCRQFLSPIGQGLSDGQLGHVWISAASPRPTSPDTAFRWPPGAVVVNGDDRDYSSAFGQSPDNVRNPFLHLRDWPVARRSVRWRWRTRPVSTDETAPPPSTDAVIIATHHNDFFSGFRRSPSSASRTVAGTYATGQHNNFVVGEFLVIFRHVRM